MTTDLHSHPLRLWALKAEAMTRVATHALWESRNALVALDTASAPILEADAEAIQTQIDIVETHLEVVKYRLNNLTRVLTYE